MPKNSTDLHIQYMMETGEYFQWDPPKSTYDHSGSGYHSTSGYSRDYCKWVEEKYLRSLIEEGEIKSLNELLAYVDGDLEDAVEHINSLEEENEELIDRILKLKKQLKQK